MVEQHFCLRWNNYRTNITAEFETLREGEHFVDVTLACDGRQLKAHKVVLSACSPYFKELLQGNPCSHPIIILKDVAYTHMRSLLEFMYAGEVNISQAHLGSFLNTAEALKIRGLAESSEERKDGAGSNCLSPLTALKTSLGSFGGITLGGLGSSLLERPLIPQLLPHPGEPPPTPSQPSTPHLVPCSLPLPSTSYTSSSSNSCGGQGKASSPPEKAPAVDPHHAQGPIPLTVSAHSNDLGGARGKGDPERKEAPSSPLSLPPNKRLRQDRRTVSHGLPSHGVDKGSDKTPHNGCSSSYSLSSSSGGAVPAPSTNSVAPPKLSSGSTTSNSTTTIAAPNTTPTAPEETLNPNAVPKMEPLDPPASDTEGSVGWTEEGDGGGGGDFYPSPEPPTLQNPSNLSSGTADSENTSHLLQVLSSEPHLPGPSFIEGDRLFPPDEARSDHRIRDTRDRISTSPPLPPSSLPHSCQLCGKLISCRRNLWKHMERVHFTNPAVRCSLCAKMFKNKYALKDHQRIYHGGMSEPSHVPPSPSHSQHSLLSQILQDSRHHQSHPQDLSPLPHTPHLHPPPPPPSHSHTHSHHSFPPRRPTEEKDPSPSGGGNIASYPSLGVPSLLPHTLPSSIVGTHTPGGRRSHPEWNAEGSSYSMVNVNRTILTELHHMVSKED